MSLHENPPIRGLNERAEAGAILTGGTHATTGKMRSAVYGERCDRIPPPPPFFNNTRKGVLLM